MKDNISDTLYFPLEKYHGNWKDPEAVYTSFVTRAYMRLSGGGYLKGFIQRQASPEAVTIWQISDSPLKKPMC